MNRAATIRRSCAASARSTRPRAILGAAVTALLALAAPASAQVQDYAETALNIIPSGQLGAIPAPAGAEIQSQMYDGLTPLFDQVGPSDLTTYFKSSRLGVSDDQCPCKPEAVPRAGVTIVRDRFSVPHVTGVTRDDVTWATGWLAQEDRALLFRQMRYPARLAALDAPNTFAFGLVTGSTAVTPSAKGDAIIRRDGDDALKSAGAAGAALRHDIDVYVRGINDRLKAERSAQKPFTRVDVYSLNALIGQIFGSGGSGETFRGELYAQMRKRLGARKGRAVFDDLTESLDPETPTTMDKRFPFLPVPRKAAGNAIPDAGSLRFEQGANRLAGQARALPRRARMSNFLMVAANRSTNGHPLFVAGPQIGYFYPGLTLEMDLSGPGFRARGAAVLGGPGNLLIGRGPDNAWSLTSSGSDLIDDYAEVLCGGSKTKYRYRGRCRSMTTVDAGKVGGKSLKFRRTVHGAVFAYGKVNGKRVAFSSKRASYGKDILFQLFFRDNTLGTVDDAQEFFASAARSPFTFNSAYVDDRDIAVYSAGLLPKRNPNVDPRLPTIGDGRFEWRGFLSKAQHPQQVNARNGELVNWNNKPAPGFGSASDQWEDGSVQDVQLLEDGLARRRMHDLASVTAAMNRASTQDLNALKVFPVVERVLAGGPAPSGREQLMVDLVKQWRDQGASRLDRDLDGKIDHPGAAIVDAAYRRIADAVLKPVLGPQLDDLTDLLGYNGRAGYVHKDLRTVLGEPVKGKFKTRFCGRGKLAVCRASLWAAMKAAGDSIASAQGADPRLWWADANAERISFAPFDALPTIRYTNRPSGIQQLMTFSGHRPR